MPKLAATRQASPSTMSREEADRTVELLVTR
jgi:hypothetical protein